jgi:hypothetical protein
MPQIEIKFDPNSSSSKILRKARSTQAYCVFETTDLKITTSFFLIDDPCAGGDLTYHKSLLTTWLAPKQAVKYKLISATQPLSVF